MLLRLTISTVTHLLVPPASGPGAGAPFLGIRLRIMLDIQSYTNEFTFAFKNYPGVLNARRIATRFSGVVLCCVS
jgi:hypothetical protein